MPKAKEKKQTEKYSKLEEVLIQVGLRIARRAEGALMIVGKVKYKTLVEQKVPPFKIVDNPKLLESLALIDGAVVIDKKGMLQVYGAMIETTNTLMNFGTRHSAALSASQNNNLVVLVSEEDRKVKLLKNGKMIIQIDPYQKDIDKSIPYAVQILESIGAGTVGAIGTSLLAPGFGIAFIPGIVIFGSAYYISKLIKDKL